MFVPGPQARAIVERDSRVLSPSYTRDYPLVVRSGTGAVITDVDGNRFLDFCAGIAVASTGHCHPEVVAAIQAQAAQLIHMSGTDFYYENMVELAEQLCGPDRKVLFGNSGTEAVEAALKLAKYTTGRGKFIAFYGAFHGRTMGSLSLTARRPVQREGFGPFAPGVHHVPYAYCYRCPCAKSPETCNVECAAVIEEQLIRTILPAREVAAIVVEPVQGEGGYIVPPAKFHQALFEIAHRHGMLLIHDEVQCGAGRTGKLWAHEHFGVTPDIFASAKGLASGMPLGAMVARSELMTWPPGAHASTFGGNPVSVAAALVTLRLLQRELIANAAAIGAYMMDRMKEWPERFPLVGDVRGLGLMIGVELVLDQQTKERAPREREALLHLCFERGLIVLGAGENSIRLSPPLIVTRDQADQAMTTTEECLGKLEQSR